MVGGASSHGVFDDSLDLERLSSIQQHLSSEIEGKLSFSFALVCMLVCVVFLYPYVLFAPACVVHSCQSSAVANPNAGGGGSTAAALGAQAAHQQRNGRRQWGNQGGRCRGRRTVWWEQTGGWQDQRHWRESPGQRDTGSGSCDRWCWSGRWGCTGKHSSRGSRRTEAPTTCC